VLELRNSSAVVAGQVHELPAPGAKLVAPNCGSSFIALSDVRHFETDWMNELRIYTNIQVPETRGGFPVFYSRREGGPYYRWSYDDAARNWQAGRVLPATVSPRAFATTAWKEVPNLLKRSIADHYQD
jgi:hypothetical protein